MAYFCTLGWRSIPSFKYCPSRTVLPAPAGLFPFPASDPFRLSPSRPCPLCTAQASAQSITYLRPSIAQPHSELASSLALFSSYSILDIPYTLHYVLSTFIPTKSRPYYHMQQFAYPSNRFAASGCETWNHEGTIKVVSHLPSGVVHRFYADSRL